MSILRTCLHCSTLFMTRRIGRVKKGQAAYCSWDCYTAILPENVTLACQFCGTLFQVNAALAHRGTSKYCSSGCYWSSIPSRPLEKVLARFWERVDVCPHAPSCLFCCWLWQGSMDAHGYGKISVASHPVHVHRLSWAWHNYPERIPEDYGPTIRHMCHQPSCVNPAHLVSGTPSLNSTDMYLAGRHPNVKLSIKQVQEIRRLRQQGMRYKAIAALFPVAWRAISDICLRRTWKHVP